MGLIAWSLIELDQVAPRASDAQVPPHRDTALSAADVRLRSRSLAGRLLRSELGRRLACSVRLTRHGRASSPCCRHAGSSSLCSAQPRLGGMTTGLVYALTFTMIALDRRGGFPRAAAGERQAMAVAVASLFAPAVAPHAADLRRWASRGSGATALRWEWDPGDGTLVALDRTWTVTKPLLLAVPVLAIVHAGAIVSARANVAAEGAQFLTSPGWHPLYASSAPQLGLGPCCSVCTRVMRSRVST